MIPATAIHFNDDGTAWSLLYELAQYVPAAEFPEVWLDRQCDTCGGDGVQAGIGFRCTFCDGTGRHTLTVEVGEQTALAESDPEFAASLRSLTLRVSVVPGMVLPVHVIPSPLEPDEMMWKLETTPQPFIGIAQVSGLAVLVEHDRATPIALPPDAKVGGYAVKVKVH
jgi:hypothetical protein